jgi:predicted alpha/beta-fold hydrolase
VRGAEVGRLVSSPAFVPPRWARNPHLQTVWGPLVRRRRLSLRRERIETDDGDFVDLDWLDGPARAPLILLLHGLEGCARSHYVSGLLGEVQRRSWRGVLLNFRSCSGELNRGPRFYHSGDTGDLGAVVRRLAARDEAPVGAVGVSIGGNVLLKWLGEHGNEAPVEAAVGISVPFDLTSCARVLDRGVRRLVYTANFMRTMRRKAIAKAAQYPGLFDVARVRRARTFAEYDRLVTAPLHGFLDECDYWSRASSAPYLSHIRRPTLLVNALDDPFIPPASLPEPASLPAPVRAEWTTHGGHVGFVDSARPSRASWAERRAIGFLATTLARHPAAR